MKAHLRRLLRASWAGLKQNLVPGLLLQGFALAVVLGYMFLPPLQDVLNKLGVYKRAYGYGFSAVMTVVFGGLIPFAYMVYAGLVPAKQKVAWLLFFVGFMGWKGMEVDLLYRILGEVAGHDHSVKTVITKVCLDQFIYNALWATPSGVVCYMWKDCRFSLAQTKAQLNKEFWTLRLPTVLVSAWGVWGPASAIIYCMPADLQIILFNLVLSFWACLLATLTNKERVKFAQGA